MGLNSDLRMARVGPSGESKHQAGLLTPEEGVPLMGGESSWSCDSEMRGWRRATLGLLRGLRDVGAGRAERSRRPQPAMLPGDKGPTLGAATGQEAPDISP